MTEDRLITPARRAEDVDAALRPKTLDEFAGLDALVRLALRKAAK